MTKRSWGMIGRGAELSTDMSMSPGRENPQPTQSAQPTRTLVLGAGCFWCLDSPARRLQGVTAVRSVYAGGTGPAVCQAVCRGTTGHAEAVEITYDPQVLPTEVLFDVLPTSHDPTSPNRQGYDIGTQYRSAVFCADEQERGEFAARRPEVGCCRVMIDPKVSAMRRRYAAWLRPQALV